MFFDHNFTEWFMRQSQTHFALRRFRKKSRAKCCGRTDPFLFCWSFAFLLTLALLVLACNRRRICCQYNHFQGMSYSQFNRRRSNSFPSKARGSDPAISRQTILAFFSDEIDPDLSYKSWHFNGQQKVYVRWPKILEIFEAGRRLLWRLAKIWRFAKIWPIFQFGVAFIVRYLLTDLPSRQTGKALLRLGL